MFYNYFIPGNFGNLLLSKGIGDYALESSLNDHRFSPVKISELKTLRVSVSLLVMFEKAEHCSSGDEARGRTGPNEGYRRTERNRIGQNRTTGWEKFSAGENSMGGGRRKEDDTACFVSKNKRKMGRKQRPISQILI